MIAILTFIFSALIAYFVIQLAVRHGIESSETHQLLKEIVQKIDDDKKDSY
ncbi:MAG TPA: hypothetical protein VK077_08585 [Virgibacillus sp.]|nr:hypothetical protein [Virgibacillus sp.]